MGSDLLHTQFLYGLCIGFVLFTYCALCVLVKVFKSAYGDIFDL
jgi:hypothetical protein